MNSSKKMRQPLIFTFSLACLAVAFTAQAQETHFGDVNEDLYFPNGVLLEGTNSTTPGTANIEIGGSGTLTIGNQAGGGFPRLMIVGGTKITSVRSFAPEEINVTTWDGQFTAPGSSVKPNSDEITFSGYTPSPDVEAVAAFNWGLANEKFTFAPKAEVALPVDEQDGQKLWTAYEASDDWQVKSIEDFCIADKGLCTLSVGDVNKIALVKENFDTCPITNISNGSVGSIPSCVITCDSGYELNSEANGCETISFGDGETAFDDTTTETGFTGDDNFLPTEFVAPAKEYEFPPGHFRYRASSEKFYRMLDEEGLDETDLEVVRHQNTTYLSRNPRTAAEQIAAREAREGNRGETAAEKDGFISYLIEMRNKFGDNAQENHFTALSDEGGESHASAPVDGAGDDDDGDYYAAGGGSTGGLLPSTGPGMFLGIAVVGFMLMLFGARRS